MLAGLERSTSGRILIGERVINNVPPQARDVAMVFQSYALYPHMTVYDNLAFGLRNLKVPKREIPSRVRRAADMLDLTPLLKRKPKQLSGGQRQRVALGRAIVRQPAAFLMDEPLSNLDAQLRVATRAEILKLQRELGTTTVYVTHDQVEAMTMGDRIVVMRDGVLQQVGHPRDLRASRERVRGRVHRLAGDEHRAGPARRRGQRQPRGGLPAGACADGRRHGRRPALRRADRGNRVPRQREARARGAERHVADRARSGRAAGRRKRGAGLRRPGRQAAPLRRRNGPDTATSRPLRSPTIRLLSW